MKESTFNRMFAYSAILAGIFAFFYAYYFVIAKNVTLYSLFLLLFGLAALEVMVGLFGRLKSINEDIARLALVLGVIGATGMAIHGGYDLANAINPPSVMNTSLPSQVDPRGLLTFLFMGFGIIKISWLMSKDKNYTKGLYRTGFITGLLLLVIYIARMTVLDLKSPVLLYPVLVNGLIVNPLWYLWLGYSMLKKK